MITAPTATSTIGEAQMSSTPDPIQFARLADGIIVIRVNGKGTHVVSPSLCYVFDTTRDQTPPPRYIIDLDNCTTMDSTFMGTLASIGLFQRRATGTSVIVINIQDHVRHLLNTLGLKYVLDMRKDHVEMRQAESQMTAAPQPALTTVQRICMMLEAHERLVDIDSENEVKFEGVLKSLRDSLNRAE